MKKNITLGIAFILMTILHLNAQDSTTVSSLVANSFQKNFAGARNAMWTNLSKGITQAQFLHKGNSWIAYFDAQGNVVTSGRRIKSASDLPIQVQNGLERVKARMEKKEGPCEIFNIFEMTKLDETKYFVGLFNATTLATYSIASNGHSVLELKKPRIATPTPRRNAIAKKD